jgi:hypothetical protein
MTTPRNIYQLIEHEHERIDTLYEQCLRGARGPRADHGADGKLRGLLTELDRVVRQVLESERRTLHAWMRRRGQGTFIDHLQSVLHPHIVRLLDDLRHMQVIDPLWLTKLQDLGHSLHYLFYEEEHELFARSREVLSPCEARQLGHEMRRLCAEIA